MQLDTRASYLALHDVPDGIGRTLSLHTDFDSAIAGWTVGSRVSPVWRLTDGGVPAEPADFRQCEVTFLGPVPPARLPAEVAGFDAAGACWTSLGCFNMVVQTAADEQGRNLAAAIAAWSRAQDVAFEQWVISNSIVQAVDSHVLPKRESKALPGLTSHADNHKHPAVRSNYQENLVATATCLARAAAVFPPIHDEIDEAANSIGLIMERFADGDLTLLEMQSRLLTMNAALSRFSSQAFSGIPPILSTECHFWIHSLLGTGSANLALASLVASVQQTLGEARLPERLRQLTEIEKRVPTRDALTGDPALLDFDIMAATDVPPGTGGPVVPLITYFSGRDGFSSHVQTLSAPLTTLAECNSLRSNLLTVTHEMSHIFIQAALAVISPTPGNADDFTRALALLEPRREPGDMLEAARQLFLEAIVAMAIEDRPNGRPYTNKELPAEIAGIVERTRGEVQEILVHTFDFLYFHSGEPDYYIKNIWHSWCAIPGIGDRVPEYLMRTLCAVSSNLLAEPPKTRFAAALRDTKHSLAAIESQIGLTDNYVGQVLAYIRRMEADDELMTRMQKQYLVRMRLVRLVRIFLFSDRLAADLFSDPHVGGGHGYRTKKALTYDTNPIGNALQFLRGHLKTNPSEAESAWVLHTLAFDLNPSPLGVA